MSGSIHIDNLTLGGVIFATDNLPRPLVAVADILPSSGLSETFCWAIGYVDSVGHGLAVRLFTWEEK